MLIPSRFTRLFAWLATPRMRRLTGILAWSGVVLYFVLGVLVLVLRYAVLPVVGDYRGDIEQRLATELGRPVAIRSIEGRWRALWPSLRIHGLEIQDAQGRPALGFEEVEADIGWSSLWRLAPHFARLEIKAPHLEVRRDADNRLYVAGLEIDTEQESDPGFAEWLLTQDRIVIRDATIGWYDELRQAPPLVFSRLNLDLRNRGKRHRFGLTAEPPTALAARLDLRGDFRADDPGHIETWVGQLYSELDHADLAGWRPWTDYPVELPRGKGGVRLWLDIEHQLLMGATADLRLSGTSIRLARRLPMLRLKHVEGRIAGKYNDQGFSLQTQRLSLATQDGVAIEPTDLDLQWQPSTGRRPARGTVRANVLDIGALANLASYLPLAPDIRKPLLTLAPQGRLSQLQLSWTGDADALLNYRIKSRFEGLGLRPVGVIPGFAGLDGRIDGDERGGSVELASEDASIDLPKIFEDSALPLNRLDASAAWVLRDGQVEVELAHARFHNTDAAGEASGRYRGNGQTAGEIDLTARLTRAGGGAVWRYMPLVVSADVREWLHASIGGGMAKATLRLKGDLDHFPFRDGSGVFEITGPFEDAQLRYAPSWPPFEKVSGDLLFVGPRMVISARQARLWGVVLSDVKAEVADLDAPDVPMVITGTARGPTTDFLRFVDASPVGEHIGRVTEGMVAEGQGELKLRLDLPLQRVADTRVDGRLRVADNRLNYFAGFPPLAEVSGDLNFTEHSLEARQVTATMLGAPVNVDITTVEGRVRLNAQGTTRMSALEAYYGSPLLAQVAGTADWHATVDVSKGTAEVRLDSSLLGIASQLPTPFSKSAFEARPLAFVFRPHEGAQHFTVTLDELLRAEIVRQPGGPGEAKANWRGLVAVGREAGALPERGVLLSVDAARLDLDPWRQLADSVADGGAGGGASAAGLPVDQVDLRADEVKLFGRTLHDATVAGSSAGDMWRFDVKSKEADGRIEWLHQANGDRLTGRLARFDLTDSDPGTQNDGATEETERLPEIDLMVEQFLFRGRELGTLKMSAQNQVGLWNVGFDIQNSDGHLAGTGRWRMPQPGVAANTALDFSLDADNLENTLNRIGYPDAVRRGNARLGGSIAWSGAPTRIDYPTLNGHLVVEANRGQFKKLEPGVGRLLGVLSLQSLPRRITLDFRDIFSEGFAFDSIDGSITAANGILSTQELEIDGPAALVLMSGTVDLVNETQDLKVRVQPTIGETVATGVLLINPVVGATAWLMNRMFGNPLDKVFAFDYAITGPWSDPKVDKIGVQGPGIARAAEETVVP